MKTSLKINLDTGIATLGTKTWAATGTFGDQLTLGISFQRSEGGSLVDKQLTVSSLAVAVGALDARPTGGGTKIQVGGGARTSSNTTAEVPCNADALTLQTALNALSAEVAIYGLAKVWSHNGSMLIVFGDGTGGEVPLALVDNRLFPVSFGRVSAWQVGGQWIHELRFTQAPVAYSDITDSDRELPPAPVITRVQAGGTDSGVTWNEIQKLVIPASFTGNYDINLSGARTAVLSAVSDGPDQIAATLGVFGSSFSCSVSSDGVVLIEWKGTFAGESQTLLVATVVDPPPAELTVTVDLGLAPMAVALRGFLTLSLPLSIRALVRDDLDPTIYRPDTLLTTTIVMVPPLIWPDMATLRDIDWARPLNPVDYIPRSSNTILLGRQSAMILAPNSDQVGTTAFSILHNLATEDIASVTVRENVSGGRLLVMGSVAAGTGDFEVRVPSANVVLITLIGALAETPPELNAYEVIVSSAAVVDSFAAGLTLTTAQVFLDSLDTQPLDAWMAGIAANLATLNAYFPSISLPAIGTNSGTYAIPLPATVEALFYRGLSAFDPLNPGRPPIMLPAIHFGTATVDTLPTTPLPDPVADTIWSTSAAILIPCGERIRAATVPAGGFVGSDGRILFPVSQSTQAATPNSYYPTQFERILWEIEVNDAMLRVNQTLPAEFILAAQLLASNCRAQWLLVIERGTIDNQTSPTGTDPVNLSGITWITDAPLLAQRIILSPRLTPHPMGVRIARTGSTTLTCDRMRYNVWEGANSTAPSTANFALRARLIEFDTENAFESTAIGWVYYKLLALDGKLLAANIA